MSLGAMLLHNTVLVMFQVMGRISLEILRPKVTFFFYNWLHAADVETQNMSQY
jgi:hypothetical protein